MSTQEYIENLERLYTGYQSFRMCNSTYEQAVIELTLNRLNNTPMSERTLDLLTSDAIA